MERNKLSLKNKWLENVWENNPAITLNILYFKVKEIWLDYISKINLSFEKQKFLLMIRNAEKEG